MTTVKLRYVRKKRGKLFWEPTPEMRAKGFLPKPLGDDGPAAHQEASRLYTAWLAAKDEDARPTKYPPGTFGAYWDRFRLTGKWAKKAPRTREDYERAWKHIDAWRPDPERPTLARTVITRISTEDCEAFFDHLEADCSPNERHRTIKCLKILLADAMVRLRLAMPSPASTLANPQPSGRSAFWLGAEIEQLADGAWSIGYRGMAVAIRIAWDSMFSPVDVWTLKPPQIAQDGRGRYVDAQRGKTGKQAYGALSAATAALLDRYLAELGVEIPEDGHVIRQRNGHAYRSKDTFGDDFRAVRHAVFGKSETRQFLDIRRSANVEADVAGADKATMGELLANGLADSSFLDQTYTPPTVAKARDVAQLRLQGRKKLAAEATRIRTKRH